MVFTGNSGRTQLDDLGTARPYVLRVRGAADLPSVCAQSVAIIGARAVAAYGKHVTGQIVADMAERGWTVVSGGS